MFVQAVWNLKVPPRIQIFLWLLSKNKILARDNLARRREVSDKTCVFCNELESVTHLFFECCVAKRTWFLIAEICDINGDWNYEYVATMWIANKKYLCKNIITSAVLWCLWNLRNRICFQGLIWTGEKMVILWIARILRKWKPMLSQDLGSSVELMIQKLEDKALQPPSLCWKEETYSSLEVSDSQALVPVSIDVIQSDVALALKL